MEITFLAQCLCTITEDNPTAATSLANSKESLNILEKNLLCSDATEELLLLKVHMAGITSCGESQLKKECFQFANTTGVFCGAFLL
jgi:hypothetical protein